MFYLFIFFVYSSPPLLHCISTLMETMRVPSGTTCAWGQSNERQPLTDAHISLDAFVCCLRSHTISCLSRFHELPRDDWIQPSCPQCQWHLKSCLYWGWCNWHQVMDNYICRELTLPACLPTNLGNYRGHCQRSINITGKASLCVSQTMQAVHRTLSRLCRFLFPRTTLSCADNTLSGSNCLESSSVEIILQLVGNKCMRKIVPLPFLSLCIISRQTVWSS